MATTTLLNNDTTSHSVDPKSVRPLNLGIDVTGIDGSERSFAIHPETESVSPVPSAALPPGRMDSPSRVSISGPSRLSSPGGRSHRRSLSVSSTTSGRHSRLERERSRIGDDENISYQDGSLRSPLDPSHPLSPSTNVMQTSTLPSSTTNNTTIDPHATSLTHQHSQERLSLAGSERRRTHRRVRSNAHAYVNPLSAHLEEDDREYNELFSDQLSSRSRTGRRSGESSGGHMYGSGYEDGGGMYNMARKSPGKGHGGVDGGTSTARKDEVRDQAHPGQVDTLDHSDYGDECNDENDSIGSRSTPSLVSASVYKPPLSRTNSSKLDHRRHGNQDKKVSANHEMPTSTQPLPTHAEVAEDEEMMPPTISPVILEASKRRRQGMRASHRNAMVVPQPSLRTTVSAILRANEAGGDTTDTDASTTDMYAHDANGKYVPRRRRESYLTTRQADGPRRSLVDGMPGLPAEKTLVYGTDSDNGGGRHDSRNIDGSPLPLNDAHGSSSPAMTSPVVSGSVESALTSPFHAQPDEAVIKYVSNFILPYFTLILLSFIIMDAFPLTPCPLISFVSLSYRLFPRHP